MKQVYLSRMSGLAVVAVAALVLSSCSGMSSSGSGTMPVAMMGTMQKTGGAVALNGASFNAGSASVIADNKMSSLDALGSGMTVKLKGMIAGDRRSGVAERVKALAEVRGVIASIGTDSFTLLGQTVLVGSTTFFANVAGFSALKVGDRVEVHGMRDASGNILATRIELLGPAALAEQDEVRGIVSNMTATTFDIGGLTITFSSATRIEPPGAAFGNGDLVEVHLNGTTAIDIEVESLEDADFEAGEGQEFEVEGFITGFTDPASDFMVAEQKVHLAADVSFRGGDQTDLGNNVLVEAEGALSGGILLADRIIFKDSIRIEANADIAGSAGVLGLTVILTPSAILDNLPGGLADIKAGDGLRIRGFLAPDGITVMATRVKRLDSPVDPARIVLQGPVSSVDATPGAEKLVIAGITVSLAGLQPGEIMNDEGPISLPGLLASIVPNATIVEARGSFSNGILAAKEIEIKDD